MAGIGGGLGGAVGIAAARRVDRRDREGRDPALLPLDQHQGAAAAVLDHTGLGAQRHEPPRRDVKAFCDHVERERRRPAIGAL